MSIFNQFPWTNYHEYNLDWVIRQVKEIKDHISELVIDATSDILDDTLTDPDKAAQAKAAGDAIRANASDITAADARITALNSRYESTVSDVSSLTTRMTNAEDDITDLQSADNTLGSRITALETAEQPNTYKFTIYQNTSANFPYYACNMTESLNNINSLITDLNTGRMINAYANIRMAGVVTGVNCEIANLTAIRVSGIVHGVEFDAGDFHCTLMDSDTDGTAYFRHVVITGTSYTLGDFNSIYNYQYCDVSIIIANCTHKPIMLDPVNAYYEHGIDIHYGDYGQGSLDIRTAHLNEDGTITYS